MAKKTVYLETSVIGYATSRPSRDLVVAAHQQITREWFAAEARAYQLFISQLVVQEASSGDHEAARSRVAWIESMPLLAVTDAVGALAVRLVEQGAMPRTAAEDAVHVALAAVHGIDFLLTWNCKHIANAAMRQVIEETCRDDDYDPPVICTPEELMHDSENR